jgi:CRISPR/Cas system CSM-associated protein Csm2 small subunit
MYTTPEGRIEELEAALSSVRTDLAYAVRQLREFREVSRALDALERAIENVNAALPDE